MAINDRIVLDIHGKSYPAQIVFEGDFHSKHHEWQDTVAVAKVDNGLFVAMVNRLPISQPVPKGVAVQSMMNHMQQNMK